jgi:hypothetical protein
MAAKAVNRRMPSTERSYTSYYPRMTFSSEQARPSRAWASRCLCFEIEQEEIDV